MSRSLLVLFCMFSIAAFAACGDNANPIPPSQDDPNPDMEPGVMNPDPNPAPTPDADPNPVMEPEVNPFEECGGDLGGCGGTESCLEGVCVPDPAGMVTATIGKEEGDRVLVVPESPNIDCYTNPTPTGDDIQYVEIRGEIEKFGVGGSTVGLCVTVLNYDRFLADRATRCADVAADEDDYEECLEVDPCRCESEHEGDQAAIDGCFDGLGYCNGITDATLQQTCRDRHAFDGTNPNRDADIESGLVYGHQVSIVPPNGDNSEGFFTIPGVPTNTRLVIKVSGRTNRWIDTYEFGPVLTEPAPDTNDRDADGDTEEIFDDWGGNVISIGAWNTIPSTALVPSGIKDGNGAIAGRINDCGQPGRSFTPEGEDTPIDASGSLPISNATVALTHDATRITYFNGNPDDTLPQPDRITTNSLAVYAAINAPGGFNRLSTSVRIDGNPELQSVGIRDIFLSPRSVAIVTFEGEWEPATW